MHSKQVNLKHFYRTGVKLFQVLIILAFIFSLLGVGPAGEAFAEEGVTKIAVITDFGVAISDSHKANIATLVTNWDPDAVVTGGDNYHDRDPYCSSYAQCVAGYNSYSAGYTDFVSSETFFPAYGNHDAWTHSAEYTSYFSYLPSVPDPNHLYYDVVVGNVHFWVLNGNVTLTGSAQQTWLAANAPDESVAWNIAVVHQAPYGTGFYGDIASTQLPYQDYGIDFVISGHNHHYERLERNGVRYFIAGRAGVTEGGRTCDGTGSAATVEFCAGTQNPPLDNYGYMQIVATGTDISLSFIDESGAVKDTFSDTTVLPTDPVITTSVNSLVAFNTTPGIPSAVQTYNVSGVRLTGNITITAPAGFEISTGGGAYGSSLTLVPTGSAVANTTISVRLTGAAGTWNGNITHVSDGATSRNVAVNGTAIAEITSVAVSDIVVPEALGNPDTSAAIAATPAAGIISPTATVNWSPAVSSFGFSTAYTASVTLTAASGHKFTSGTSATVNGSAASRVLNPDGTLTVSFTFPKTGDVPPTAITNVAVINIIAPAALATPDPLANVSATPTMGILSSTASVTWSPADNPFGYSKVYTASVTLTAATGYQFTSGTTTTVNGQAAVVVLNNDGTLTVSFTFPMTEAEPVIYELYLPLILK